MPRINSFKIINFKYKTDGSRLLDDRKISMLSRNCQFDATNSCGKSMNIQTLIQAICPMSNVSKKAIDIYNQKEPVYSVIEWLTDTGNTFIIGIGFERKATITTTANKMDNFKYFTFVIDGDNADINMDNLGIVKRNKDKKKIILSLKEYETYLRELSKNGKDNIKVFPQSANARYAEALAERGLSQKEWKEVIINLNKDEAVLSKFFEKFDTVAKLFMGEIIPLINLTLSTDGIPRINVLKDNVEKFLTKVKNNITAVKGYDEQKEFKRMLEELSGELLLVIENETAAKEIKDSFGTLYNTFANLMTEISDEIQEIENKVFEIEDGISDLEYNKLSLAYLKNKEKSEKITLEVEELNNNLNEFVKLETKLNDDLNLINLREEEKELSEIKVELAEMSLKKEKLEATITDISEKINTLGASINNEYKLLIEEAEKKAELTKTTLDEKSTLKESIEKDVVRLEKRLKEVNNSIDKYNISKDNVEKMFDELHSSKLKLDQYKKVSLLGTEILFDRLLLDLNMKIDDKKAEVDKSQNAINQNTEKKVKLDSDISDMKLRDIELSNILKFKKEELSDFVDYEEKLKELIDSFDIDSNLLYEKDAIVKELNKKIVELDESYNNLVKNYYLMETKIQSLESSAGVEYDKALIETLKNNNIDFILGTEYITAQNNENILRRNPVLAYSIIMTQKDYDKFLKVSNIQYTSFVTPIVVRENLRKKLIDKTTEFIYSGGENIDFVFNIDIEALDENKIREEIEKLSLDLESIGNEKDNIQEFKNDIMERITFVKSKDLDNYTISSLEKEIKSIEDEIISISHKRVTTNNEIESLGLNIKANNKRVQKISKDIEADALLYGKVEMINQEYSKIISLKEEVEKNCEKAREINQKLTDKTSSVKELVEVIDTLKMNSIMMNNNTNILKEQNEEYKVFNGDSKLEEISLEEAIAMYKELKNNSSLYDIVEINNSITRLDKKKEKKTLKKIELEEMLNNEFDKERIIITTKKEIKEKIAENSTLKNNASNKLNAKNNALIKSNTLLENKYSNIKEKFVREPNMDAEIMDYDEEIAEAKSEIQELNLEISSLNKLLSKSEVSKISLNEYKDEKNTEAYELSFDSAKKLLDSNRTELSKLNKQHSKLEGCSNSTISKITEYAFKATTDFSQYISIIDIFKNDTFDLKERIDNNMCLVLEEQIKILEVENEAISKHKQIISNDLKMYSKDFIQELKTFNRLGKMDGKQLFEIILPRDENVNFTHIDDLIEELMADDLDSALIKIDTFYIMNRLINISALKIKVYKPEISNKYEKIDWNRVQKETSGGQRFAISFIFLIMLLQYKRIGLNNESQNSGKVLLMDNPFGQTSNAEFLNLVFELADKFNVQIISYTHIANQSIRDMFDLIYKMNVEQLTGGKEFVVIEEVKNNVKEKVNMYGYKIAEAPVQISMLEV